MSSLYRSKSSCNNNKRWRFYQNSKLSQIKEITNIIYHIVLIDMKLHFLVVLLPCKRVAQYCSNKKIKLLLHKKHEKLDLDLKKNNQSNLSTYSHNKQSWKCTRQNSSFGVSHSHQCRYYKSIIANLIQRLHYKFCLLTKNDFKPNNADEPLSQESWRNSKTEHQIHQGQWIRGSNQEHQDCHQHQVQFVQSQSSIK